MIERTLREVMNDVRGDASAEAEALSEGCVRVAHDPELEATVVLVGFGRDVELPLGAAELSRRSAAACAVEELVHGLGES